MQIAKRMRLDCNTSTPRREDDDVDVDDEDHRTLFCTNLNENVTEQLLYELFIQSGPIESVRIPKDKDGRQRTFGFVTFAHACTVSYALDLYAGTRLYNRELIIKPRNSNSSRNRNSDSGRSSRCDGGDFQERDESPYSNRYRNENNANRRSQTAESSNSLRGGNNRQNRIDMSMQPQYTSPKQLNRQTNSNLKIDSLEQLSHLIFNPFKDVNSFDSNLNDALSGGMESNRGRGGGGGGGNDPHSSRSNRPHQQNSPYNKWPQQTNARGNSDQNRNRGGGSSNSGGGDWNSRSSNRRDNSHKKQRR